MPLVAGSETPSTKDICNNGYARTMEGAEFVLNRLKLWNILSKDAKF